MLKAFIKRSTRQQWVIILSTLTLLLVTVLAAFTWFVFREGLLESVERSRDLAATAAAKVELILADNKIILEKIAQLPAVRQFETQACDPTFKTLNDFRAGQFARINLVAKDGRLICEPNPKAMGREEATRNHPWFIKAIAAEDFAVGDAFRSVPSGEWISPLTHVVRNDAGETIGLVVLSLDLKQLSERIFTAKESVEGFRAVMLDGAGQNVINSDPTLIGSKTDASNQITERLGNFTFRSFGTDKTWRLVGRANVAGSDWRVFVGIPEDIALADARKAAYVAAGIGVLILILFAGPAIWFGRFSLKRDEISRQQVDELSELHDFMWANIPEGAAFFNDTGIILDANNQLATILQRPRSEIIGHKLNEFTVDEKDIERSKVRQKGFNRWTTTFRRPDGSLIDIETKVQSFAADARRLYIGVFRDFTDLKRAEAELRKSEELLEQTGRVASIGGWELDLATMTPRWTAETHRLHDLPTDHFPTIEEAITFFAPEGREKLTRAVNEAIHNGTPYDLELPFTTAKGRELWVRTLGRPIIENGKITRLIGTIQDFTAKKATEQQLEEARARAEIASNAKSSFIAIMSHEIRTPLTGIMGMADLLLTENLAPSQRNLIERLLRSGRVLLDLINDVLDFSKIEANKLDIEHVTFVPHDIFTSVKELLDPIAEEKLLKLNFNIATALATPVIGDPKRLRQVLVNLIGNALKFTERGQVSVNAAHERTADQELILRVLVSDTGPGISSDAQQNLFKPYVQGDQQTSKRAPGTGLGLSISRLLVEAMGGTIEVSSLVGRGSSFSFTIKLQALDKAAMGEPALAQRAALTPLRPLRILAAEDNDTSRFLIKAMLERKGHQIDSVVNGAEALEAARTRNYDLILMDMQMPVMDGMEAVRHIRKLNSPNAHIPIIALTADLIDENRNLYLSSGVDCIVGKPVDWTALDIEMAAQLATPRTNRETVEDGQEKTTLSVVAPNSEPLIDQSAHDSMRETLGSERFDMLLSMFRENLKKYAGDIHVAVAQNDLQQAKRAAHALRGLAVQFGAMRVASFVEFIEVQTKDLDSVKKTMPELDVAVTATLDQMKPQG